KQVLFRQQPWPRMFQLRSSKNGDAKRLREAIKLSLDCGLLAMRPCWLVNPAAASQLFPLKPNLFDLVIFDEASQCPVEQALPAIFRGKTLVVAGDEKQLPPTSFFASSLASDQADELDEEGEATSESVLTPQRRLQRASAAYLMQVEDLLEASRGCLSQ